MRKVPNFDLWIGNIGDLRDPRLVLSHGIQAVIELADNEPMAVLPRELVRCRYPICDGAEDRLWLLRMAAESTAAFLQANVLTLVCCSNGMSRSVCIAAAGLSITERTPLKETLSTVVGTGPADVSPMLFASLQRSMRIEARSASKGE